MSRQVLHLIDPEGHLRRASESLRARETVQHETMEDLAHVVGSGSRPSIVVADVSADEAVPPGAIGPDRSSPLHLVLVVTRDESTGAEWLRAGAFDFVPIERIEGELEARCARALEWNRILVSPEHQEERTRASISRLAHELKNPLNCIYGYLQLLATDPDVIPRVQEDIGRALENTETLIEIIQRTTDDLARETPPPPADSP